MVPTLPTRLAPILLIALLFAAPARAQQSCAAGPAAAAAANAASLRTIAWAPFGRTEAGWETYAPAIARVIATTCAPATPRFAGQLAKWQAAHRLPATGIVDTPTFEAISKLLQSRRPYVTLRARGTCPAAPGPERLAVARPAEGYLGKRIVVRPAALAAYRRMVAAARAAVPGLRSDARWLSIFSGFRDPAADAARCATEGNCQGITRARCSAHRTGLAFDLYVGESPGFGPDSSNDGNRRAMVKTSAYTWLLANAGRFGFVNYPFEPWHWEWTGEAP